MSASECQEGPQKITLNPNPKPKHSLQRTWTRHVRNLSQCAGFLGLPTLQGAHAHGAHHYCKRACPSRQKLIRIKYCGLPPRIIGGFPKLGVPLLVGLIIFWGLYWGPPVWETTICTLLMTQGLSLGLSLGTTNPESARNVEARQAPFPYPNPQRNLKN